VQAVSSNATRGYPVPHPTAMIFTFGSGALGTFLLSDTAASPRSWEQTSGENMSYANDDDEDCYHIAGTRGSLSVPTMRLKVYDGEPSWWEPFTSSVADVERTDPLAHQIEHFAAVIRDGVPPICSGRDALNTLMVVHAVNLAARTGRPVGVV
jgi:predicted dehydrogenase